jgi:hypothetical protein
MLSKSTQKVGNAARHWQYQEKELTVADRDVARMSVDVENLRAAHKDAAQRKFAITQCWELDRKCGENCYIYGITVEVTYCTRIAKIRKQRSFGKE